MNISEFFTSDHKYIHKISFGHYEVCLLPEVLSIIVSYVTDLSLSWLSLSCPFVRTSVDFCGSVYVRSGMRRIQSYTTVFVSFVTRAIHLKLVRNLITNVFMDALFRFMIRREQCVHLYLFILLHLNRQYYKYRLNIYIYTE